MSAGFQFLHHTGLAFVRPVGLSFDRVVKKAVMYYVVCDRPNLQFVAAT
jgi:hypothetical protein